MKADHWIGREGITAHQGLDPFPSFGWLIQQSIEQLSVGQMLSVNWSDVYRPVVRKAA
jgi:hypothetical protein